MINILKSEEKMIKLGLKFSLLLGLLLAAAGLTSCSSEDKRPTQEVSLKSDRSLLDKYRTEIPQDVKDENDFMALVLKDMAEIKMKPADVRNRYYKEVRRKRDTFNREHRKIRENFNRDAKKKRDAFLSDLKKQRDAFVASKPSSQESRDFFQEQNVKRTAFFQDQSDSRKEFESQMDQARRDFNDDMNLKQKQFDDVHREYIKNFQEKEKQDRQKKLEMEAPTSRGDAIPPGRIINQPTMNQLQPASYPGQEKDLQEFDNLKNGKREKLGN